MQAFRVRFNVSIAQSTKIIIIIIIFSKSNTISIHPDTWVVGRMITIENGARKKCTESPSEINVGDDNKPYSKLQYHTTETLNGFQFSENKKKPTTKMS